MTESKKLAMMERNIVSAVEQRVEKLTKSGKLHLPKNYSAENALKAAWLVLQETMDKNGKPVLQTCSNSSIANALLKMIIMGLNPIKKQCDFIAYGKKLVCQPEYFGNIALAKRKANVKEVYPQVIYKGDEFEYEINKGVVKIIKHKQSFESRAKAEYLGGYCIVEFNDERPDHVEIMTMDEIEQAWKQGQNYKNIGDYKKGTGTHGKFTEQMIKKTVTNRACKRFINSSDDSDLFIDAYNEADSIRVEQEVQQEIEENANTETIDIDDYEEIEAEEIEAEESQPEPESQEESPSPEEEDKPQGQPKQEQMAMEGPGF